jgi:hypothetical protein
LEIGVPCATVARAASDKVVKDSIVMTAEVQRDAAYAVADNGLSCWDHSPFI